MKGDSNENVEILLIEDNHEEAQLVIRSIKKTNFSPRLIHFDDGEEAMDFIFARNHFVSRAKNINPKLILMDLKLPKIDGLDILRKVKTNDQTRYIPIVIMSSSRQELDILRSYDLGANSYIVKPVNFEEFGDMINVLSRYWLTINESPKRPGKLV